MIKTAKYSNLTVYYGDGVDPANHNSTVLALGTFDGVHIAHRGLLMRAVDLKNEIGATLCGAFCFYQSPISYLRGIEIPTICTFDQKLELMLSSGLDFVVAADFSAFCNIEADEFIKSVLCDKLGCVGAVCGFNHRFGKGGKGNADLLRKMLGEQNVICHPEVTCDGETVSSTAIRNHLASGEMEIASRMLGRPFTLKSQVLQGKKLGRTIGCPTANQVFPENAVRLKHGIYATLCTTEDGKTYVGASNVGVRPSIDGNIDDHSLNCETLIADFSRELYGETLTVEFYEYLREEKKFNSLDELSAAIKNDLCRAMRYFEDRKLK